MPIEAPAHIQAIVEQWWRHWGFSGNPFKSGVSEKDFLPHTFIDTGKFKDIYGDPQKPATILFFADRGCGKTAHRLKLENDSAPIRPDSEIFSIVYARFEDWKQSSSLPTPELHLRLILQQGLEAIFKTISSQSGGQIRKLPGAFYALLKPLIERYHPEVLNRLNRGLDLSWFRGALDRKACTSFQTRLRDETLIPYSGSTAFHHIQDFVEAVQLLGYHSVYVLVDAVDEVQLTAHFSWMDCLETLLADLQLMRMPGLAFKFFLPAETMHDFLSKPYVRSDKLDYAELQWPPQNLTELLRSRLRAFNRGGVDSLSMMCEPNLGRVLEGQMVEHSHGIPRNLIHIARYLIQTHCTNSSDWKRPIKYRDWEQTLQDAEGSPDMLRPSFKIPPVIIRGKNLVTISQREIKLTQNEYKFLWGIVHQANSRFTKQELVEQVYGTEDGVSDDSISGLIKRLRDKLGDNSENPRYIFTQHGTGFELKNWQLEAD